MADQDDKTPAGDIISVSLSHQGTTHTLDLTHTATITDLSHAIETTLSIPPETQKLLVPKHGLLKTPFKDPSLPLSQLDLRKPIKLMGTRPSELASLASASATATAREAAYAAQRRAQPKIFTSGRAAAPARRTQEDATYTFLSIRPLPNLPNPSRSQAYLERLAADPGIVAAMRAHKFSVGLLTEMDPGSYTESNHEGTTRILGLNRNRGEVVELRLRTDAYDGYRDYKTIRKTLCHELAHNVHSDHDRKFWDLCHQIEKEVARADWKSGGRSVGDEEFYEPVHGAEDEVAHDHGGWTGGEFVLGGGGSGGGVQERGLSRREIMAKAAEERIKKMDDERRRQGGQGEHSTS